MSNIIFVKPPMSPLTASVLREMEVIAKQPGSFDAWLESEEAKEIEREMKGRMDRFGCLFPDESEDNC